MTTPLEVQIGQLLVVGFQGTTAPPYLLDWLAQGRVGGVILFARNVENPAQLAALTNTLHRAAASPILIGIDQEGGTVARLRRGFTEIPSARALANSADPAVCEACYRVLGEEMRALGINWDYAPVLDLLYNRDNASLGVRSFGTDSDDVSLFASAAVRGLQAAGVAACPKHFPGLGNTPVDTHLALAALDTPLDHLREIDLVPYRMALKAGAASVMTTHTVYKALDQQHPATLSDVIIQVLLREELGFDGVVTSDCMEMKAITNHYGAAESAVLGALAGLDVILFSHTRELQAAAYDGLLAAVNSGRLPLRRIEQANRRRAQLLERFAVTAEADLSVITKPTNVEVSYQAALQGLRCMRRESNPVPTAENIVVIEFASLLESDILESGGQTGFGELIAERLPQARWLALRSSGDDERLAQAVDLVRSSTLTILVTRNAHLIADQRQHAGQIAKAAARLWHICLRNPDDADLYPSAATIYCTYGDSQPQLRAVVAALLGDYEPTAGRGESDFLQKQNDKQGG
ncbi:MAG: beta-N-acetylhexosaminidase [Anaerolineae bacterium]|nr:beta-N-acetylhexosaminidase [Anaerolineae bacterium]